MKVLKWELYSLIEYKVLLILLFISFNTISGSNEKKSSNFDFKVSLSSLTLKIISDVFWFILFVYEEINFSLNKLFIKFK